VVFRALGSEELTGIVDIQVGVLARRLAARRLTLTVTDAAREWLAINGFDPVYGARPLRRLVQSAIGDQLAKALLAGDIRDGDEVVVDWPDDVAGVDAESGLSVTRGCKSRRAPFCPPFASSGWDPGRGPRLWTTPAGTGPPRLRSRSGLAPIRSWPRQWACWSRDRDTIEERHPVDGGPCSRRRS
jgi:hypothetical protein